MIALTLPPAGRQGTPGGMPTEITSLAKIEEMARAAVISLPDPFHKAAFEVILQVVDWPSQDLLHSLDMDDPLALTGLYEGVPLPEKSVMDTPTSPDVVWLFREPILTEWREREGVSLQDLITHIVIHEFAHHFGWSDEDIATIDRWWE